MTQFHGIVLVLHLIGMAGIIGGFMAQLKEPVKLATRTMLDGAWTALATGAILAFTMPADRPLLHPKVEIKAMLLVAICLLLVQGKKKGSLEKANFLVVGLLAIANVVIAILWK